MIKERERGGNLDSNIFFHRLIARWLCICQHILVLEMVTLNMQSIEELFKTKLPILSKHKCQLNFLWDVGIICVD